MTNSDCLIRLFIYFLFFIFSDSLILAGMGYFKFYLGVIVLLASFFLDIFLNFFIIFILENFFLLALAALKQSSNHVKDEGYDVASFFFRKKKRKKKNNF